MTREHGRHLGLVHGGRSRKSRPVLQVGNHVDVTWKARLSEHLGAVTLEPRRGYGVEVMDEAAALTALMALKPNAIAFINGSILLPLSDGE